MSRLSRDITGARICATKKAHDSKHAADKYAEYMSKSRWLNKKKGRSYHCEYCGKWHLTCTDDGYPKELKQNRKGRTDEDLRRKISKYAKRGDWARWADLEDTY